MQVTINGTDIKARVISVGMSRDEVALEGSFEPWNVPEIKGVITGTVDEQALKRIMGPRKMVIQANRPHVFAPFHPRIRYMFDGSEWTVYRRDYKRNKVHLKEVI